MPNESGMTVTYARSSPSLCSQTVPVSIRPQFLQCSHHEILLLALDIGRSYPTLKLARRLNSDAPEVQGRTPRIGNLSCCLKSKDKTIAGVVGLLKSLPSNCRTEESGESQVYQMVLLLFLFIVGRQAWCAFFISRSQRCRFAVNRKDDGRWEGLR